MRFVAALLVPVCLWAADWRQWRGFSRNGFTPHKVDLAKLPPELTKVWQAEIGTGYSSPVVTRDRVFTFSRQQRNEVVRSLDRATGKIMWEAKYAAPFTKNKYANEMRDGPFSTPLLYNNTQLITWGVGGILSCFDAATGKLQWRNDYSSKVRTDNNFTGVAASPLGNAGRVYVHAGDDRGGQLLALDAASGRPVWTMNPNAGPGYASPIVHNYRGVSMLILLTDRSLVGVAENDGRLLWTYPFQDQWNENIVTPMAEQDKVFVSGVRNGSTLLSLELREGGAWNVTKVWHNPEVTMYMSSPVWAGDTIYGHSNRKKGQFVAIDSATGNIRWQTDGRDAASASIIQADNALLLTTVEGDLLVVSKDKEKFDARRKYKIADSAVWAHTAFADGEVYIKDETRLLAYRGL
jgi:outer membrane protein assembly factor BamB